MRIRRADISIVSLLAGLMLAVPSVTAAQQTGTGGETGEPAVSAGSILEPLRLNPPLNQELSLTISDRRLLEDGGTAFFTLRSRLRFTRGEGGMIATLRRDAVECAGPEAICTTFRRAMAAWVGTVQRFGVSPDGGIATLVSAHTAGVGAGVPRAMEVIEHQEREQPGIWGIAELREALRYVGQMMEPGNLASAAAVEPDNIAVRTVDGGRVEVVSTSTIRFDGDPSVRLSRIQRDRVDVATGLLTGSVMTSWETGSNGTPLSEREWSLRP